MGKKAENLKRFWCACLAALILLCAVPARAYGEPAGTVLTKILGTNGTVTVAMRTTVGAGETIVRIDGSSYTGNRHELIYTTDGTHWRAGETPEDLPASVYQGYWSGGTFWLCSWVVDGPDYRSEDGIHWRPVTDDMTDVRGHVTGMADLGPYHFQLDQDGGLWVSKKGYAFSGAKLSDVQEAQSRLYARFTQVQAYFSTPDTVTVEVCDQWDGCGNYKYTTVYSTSSLDWALEQSHDYRADDVGRRAAAGSITLGQSESQGVLISTWDDWHWRHIPDAPWGADTELCGYNGRTFVVHDQERNVLYASEDGMTWRSLRDTVLYPEGKHYTSELTAGYGFVWTGADYLARQSVKEYVSVISPTIFWESPYNTCVLFLDEEFHLTGSHDFGQEVLAVGYYNGVYYAKVQDHGADGAVPEALFASKDRTNWERTDILQIVDAMSDAA